MSQTHTGDMNVKSIHSQPWQEVNSNSQLHALVALHLTKCHSYPLDRALYGIWACYFLFYFIYIDLDSTFMNRLYEQKRMAP
jgi:hypothetical protein